MNEPKPCSRTVLVALDLSRAFDTVSIPLLLRVILDSSFSPVIKRWLCGYLRGRQSYVEFRGAISRYRKVTQGVPQGGVLSPTLFNAYMAGLPIPPVDIKLFSYVDDVTVLATAKPPLKPVYDRMSEYLAILSKWIKSRHMSLSAEKSSSTLFTTNTKELNEIIQIFIDSNIIPTVKRPKILGVVFDGLLTFAHHCHHVRSKVQTRNNALKCLAGTSWGQSKEVLLTTYKAIGRSVLNYAAPVWTPYLSVTRERELQTVQNAALRTITGCHLMSPETHLHAETKILPIKDHNALLSRQFLLGAYLERRPHHHMIANTPDLSCRSLKTTLAKKYGPDTSIHVPNGQLTLAEFRVGLAALHQKAVTAAIAENTSRVLLGGYPPPIADAEACLPRPTRLTLSQLRSGFCNLLKSYRARVEPMIEDVCPQCNQGPHDTRHLFACLSRPTSLTVESLWTQPGSAARFLGFNDA